MVHRYAVLVRSAFLLDGCQDIMHTRSYTYKRALAHTHTHTNTLRKLPWTTGTRASESKTAIASQNFVKARSSNVAGFAARFSATLAVYLL